MDYLRYNQTKLKAALYQGLADAVAQREARLEGRYVVLPSTHPGSPRHQNELYQDSMARVRKHGKPTMFITMTCNPKWREIVDELLPGQDCWMRPDLTARVFKMKLDSFMKDITKDGYMGRAVYHIQVIEFQKRGLPHAHILLKLANEDVPTVDDFDKYVCAEIPNSETHPRLHAIVTQNMLHGPCNRRCKNESGDCTKHFPKTKSQVTLSPEGDYPVYRRRCLHNHVKTKANGDVISVHDDTFVVPYNIYFSLRYNCHINVELATTVVVVKYLFKYITKGSDRASIRLAATEVRAVDPTVPIVIDEIQQYVDARYLSASESLWHLYGFSMHNCYPPVIKLQLHLPNHHSVLYQEGEEEAALNAVASTTLTNYFKTVSDEFNTPLSADILGGNPLQWNCTTWTFLNTTLSNHQRDGHVEKFLNEQML